jgi:hypothetical protein
MNQWFNESILLLILSRYEVGGVENDFKHQHNNERDGVAVEKYAEPCFGKEKADDESGDGPADGKDYSKESERKHTVHKFVVHISLDERIHRADDMDVENENGNHGLIGILTEENCIDCFENDLDVKFKRPVFDII